MVLKFQIQSCKLEPYFEAGGTQCLHFEIPWRSVAHDWSDIEAYWN